MILKREQLIEQDWQIKHMQHARVMSIFLVKKQIILIILILFQSDDSLFQFYLKDQNHTQK